jgi:hypothetical protein
MGPTFLIRSSIAALMLTIALAPESRATDEDLGVLTCKYVSKSRVSLAVRSTADIRCSIKYAGGQVERYKGESGIAMGLDLSFKGNDKFAFNVISSSSITPGQHPLSGKYFGSKVAATESVRLNSAGLVGGFADRIGLNPVALEKNNGVGIAAGIGFLYIEPDR